MQQLSLFMFFLEISMCMIVMTCSTVLCKEIWWLKFLWRIYGFRHLYQNTNGKRITKNYFLYLLPTVLVKIILQLLDTCTWIFTDDSQLHTATSVESLDFVMAQFSILEFVGASHPRINILHKLINFIYKGTFPFYV